METQLDTIKSRRALIEKTAGSAIVGTVAIVSMQSPIMAATPEALTDLGTSATAIGTFVAALAGTAAVAAAVVAGFRFFRRVAS